MKFFPFYHPEYIAATQGLPMRERGTYAWMLVMYYERRRPFPAEHDELFNILGARKHAERESVLRVVERFFIRDGALLRQPEADQILATLSTKLDADKGRKRQQRLALKLQ